MTNNVVLVKDVCAKNDTQMNDHDHHGNKNPEADYESYIVNSIKWLQKKIVYTISFNTHRNELTMVISG